MNDQQSRHRERPTEPLPKSVKPALLFLGFLFMVTVVIAGAAYVVDRQIYG
ncbi:MAG: hypothetical protein ABJQ98_06410 [Alloalcanivorax venustensis]|jgi:hypothetical protein|uniref:hypothetical protein n=1 Tax=Alloalcanivorax venustensis TaxID=172371 RepID=UPI001A5ADC95|nr:hypothetical protein [Alcanivorax sp.]|tara:strand:- start:87 stop:239 length:153 start_codon:yes stop_codon:yes gene_type:complete